MPFLYHKRVNGLKKESDDGIIALIVGGIAPKNVRERAAGAGACAYVDVVA